MNDHINDYLVTLSLEQLSALTSKLDDKIKAAAERPVQRSSLPPIPRSDVSAMAEALGLDISRLMRDAKKRST